MNVEFIKSIASNYNTNWTNYRNTFTKEFYEELITLKDQKKIKEILLTYNSPMHTADIVIGFYNKTIEKYNNEMLEYNNQIFNNNTISPNIPIINTENKLKILNIETQKDELIYNRHSFIIKSSDDNITIITDTNNKLYQVPNELILKHFKVAYAITLYACQGKTYKTLHFLLDDIKALSKVGAIYTLISRLSFKDRLKYEIDTLNKNLIEDSKILKQLI